MKRLGMTAAVALACYLAARLGHSVAVGGHELVAPLPGVALATLTVLGRKYWPGVFAAAFLANLAAGTLPLPALAVAGTYAGTAVLGAWLLGRSWKIDPSFATTRDVLRFVVVAGALALIGASAGTPILGLAGLVPWSRIGSAWALGWTGDALGMLIVAPVVFTWYQRPALGWRGRKALELAVLAAVAVSAGALLFIFAETADGGLDRTFWVFPLVIWSALRFGPREVVTTAAVILGMAVWGTADGHGPFARPAPGQDPLTLATFLAVCGLCALVLGAVAFEWRSAERKLRSIRDDLEMHVRERTAALARTNAVLAARTEEIESFVYVVSHDLRAPLLNAQGFSAELDRSCHELGERLSGARIPADAATGVREILSESIPTSLRYIRASVTKLQRLIDALLALSRTGRREYHEQPVDMDALVAGTLDSSWSLIRASGAEVQVGPLPPAIGDPTTLEQVLGNLVANAVTYLEPSRPGRIQIGGEVVGDRAHYWIRDNGLGIPPAARPRVFQVFQRFHPERGDGDGVGLAIVKRVVERHGGQVWVECPDPGGSVFHFTLPTLASSAPEPRLG